MNNAEIRGTVLAYQRIRGLMDQPLGDYTRPKFEEWLAWAENTCQSITDNSEQARWARQMVGPVLAAGLGAAVWMRDEVPNAGAAMRIFGLGGDRPLTGMQAWKLVNRYAWEPVINTQALEEIRRRSELRLSKLPANPTPVDVLVELTRPRAGAFPSQMAFWMAEHFRTHTNAATPYAVYYKAKLEELRKWNDRSEMALRTGDAMAQGQHLTREDWTDLIHGRIPTSRLELRAAFLTVRKFLADYWARWLPEVRLAAG